MITLLLNQRQQQALFVETLKSLVLAIEIKSFVPSNVIYPPNIFVKVGPFVNTPLFLAAERSVIAVPEDYDFLLAGSKYITRLATGNCLCAESAIIS